MESMKNIISLTKLLIVATVVFFFSFNTVSALEYFSIGGKPAYPDSNIPNSISWFIYNLKEGESKEDALYVINTYNEPLDLLIYAADSVKSSSGGFAVKQFVEPKEEVGAWVRFYPNPVPDIFSKLFKENSGSILQFCNLELDNSWNTEQKEIFTNWCKGEEDIQITQPSNEKSLLKFIFSVPENAGVGEHTGGIIVQKVEPETDGAPQGISLTTRVGIRIYETVPGEILKELSIKSFSIKKMYEELDFKRLIDKELPPEEFLLTTEIANSGNVSVDFTERISIKQILPKKSETVIDDRKFQVLRDDLFVSNFSWENPRIGKFILQNSLIFTGANDEEKTINSNSITIWIIPWREMIVGGGALILLTSILLIVKLINKKKYSGKDWERYIVQTGETLEDISTKFDVKWKVFVKTNHLKPPYILKGGQRVLVPKKKT